MTAEADHHVPVLVDTVLEDGSEVLVSGEVKGKAFAKRTDGLVATRLRPAVGVHVGVETSVSAAVNVCASAEDGRGEGDFHVGVGPVLGPAVEEVELAITEKDSTFNVDAGGIVFRIEDVVRTRALLGDASGRAGLELAVFENGKVDVAPVQVGEPDSDALANGLGRDRIGEVTGLGALHFLDVFAGTGVSTVGGTAEGRDFTALSPEVGLTGVVVVRQAEGGAVFDDLAEVATEFEPGGVVLVVIVNLVSREEEDVDVSLLHVFDDVFAGDVTSVCGLDGISGEAGNHDFLFVDRVLANDTFVGGFLSMAHAVFGFLAVVPVFDAEGGCPAGIDGVDLANFNPLAVFFDLKANRFWIVFRQRVKLSGQLKGAAVNGVERETDDVFLLNFGDGQHGASLFALLLLLGVSGNCDRESEATGE